MVIASVVVAILLVVLLVMLIVVRKTKKYVQPVALTAATTTTTTVQDRSRYSTSQVIPPYTRDLNTDSKPFVNNSKPPPPPPPPPSTIQKEYQKLLNPSPRFYLNEKVFVNDDEMAQIVGIDGKSNDSFRPLNNQFPLFRFGHLSHPISRYRSN